MLKWSPAALVLILGVPACSAIWGFDDLSLSREPDAGDAAVQMSSPRNPVPDASMQVDAATLSSYAAAVLADGPLAYWRLDETSGSIAHDLMGHYDGTVTGTVGWGAEGALSADADHAALLSGSGCFEMGNISGLDGALTIELWVAWVGVDRELVEKHASNPFAGWDLRLSGDSPPHVVFEFPANLGGFATSATIPALTFTHVVATSDGSNGVVYLNASVAGSGATPPAPVTNVPLGVGCDSRGDDFRGRLDEVAIYDHALSAESVLAHYAAANAH